MYKTKRWGLALLVLGALALAFVTLDLGQWLSLDRIKASQAGLDAWRAAQPWKAAAAFVAAYIAATALSLPGATVLTLLGGALFGLGWGLLLVSFASSIGATLAFLASRWLLRDWVQGRFGERLAAFNAGVAKDGAFYLFTLRLVPVVPFFVINLAMGLTPMRTATYYWVSQLGMLAGTAVYVNAGTQLAAIDSLRGIVSAPILLSLVLLGLFPLVARKGLDALQARRVYAGWTRPKRFDSNLVVIGGGSAGLVTAYIAAAVKAKVTLVEQHALGGDCLNTGCVPSKALIRAARVLADLKRADEFGIRTGPAEVDFAAVMQRVQQVITAIEPHDSAQRYTGLGVDVVMGRARIATPWQVDITAADGTVQSRTTRAIVIAAGARPFVPPIPGIASVEPLTSDSIWSLRERPERLLVLGGGPIGCELGQAFARLGSRVTLLEQAPRLLAREDDDVAQAVADGLAADGVDLRLSHTALRFVRDGNGKRLIAGQGSAEVAIGFDTLLVAVGRAARLEGYGLEELGIATGRTVEVDGFLRTRFPNIHAAGDVAGPWQFTHAAAHQAWYAAVNALFAPFKTFAVDARVMPAATFTTPEVARVGLNRREAAERGTAVEVTRYGLDDLDRALIDGEAHGWVEVLTAPGKDRILGVTIVGAQAAELLAEYVLAMKHGIGLNKLLGTIHAYPTLAEANKYAAGVWKKAHAPQQLLAWVERFHAWRRG
jgi:pyruvate/2-oxoglutarate dehydrogenase complex dihydrolipoamide dehydrogenase (E3) component/uncharacterized membrane protein YdjX (TVP38/TMEM64 family)